MKQACQTITLLLLLLTISSCNCDQTIDSDSKNTKTPRTWYYLRLLITPEKVGEEIINHEIYLDDSLFSAYNPTSYTGGRSMSLGLRIGEHTIKVVSKGFKTQEKSFTVMGASNKQLIRFDLIKE